MFSAALRVTTKRKNTSTPATSIHAPAIHQAGPGIGLATTHNAVAAMATARIRLTPSNMGKKYSASISSHP